MEITGGVETLTVTGAEPGAAPAGVHVGRRTSWSPWWRTHRAMRSWASSPPSRWCWPVPTAWPRPWPRATRWPRGTTPWTARRSGCWRRRPPPPGALRPGARRGLRLPRGARRRAACRSWSASPTRTSTGPAPWPTVVEYSGYGPSNPDDPQPGTLLANLLGFAVVGVNMRGTGCSGGVFDVFSPAQAADGYDVVETVARQPWVLHGRPGMVGPQLPRHQPALRRRHPAAAASPPSRRCRSSTTSGASSGRAASTTRASPGPGSRCATPRRRPGAWPGTRPASTPATRSRAANQAHPQPELRLRGVRPRHRDVPPEPRGPTGRARRRADRRPRVPDRCLAGRADRQPVRPHARGASRRRPTPGSRCSTATTPTATARW